MKKCIVIFGFFMMTFGVMADNDANKNVYIQNLVMEMQNAMDNTDLTKLDSEAQDFVKRIENMPDEKIAYFKLLFFSERLLWRVYDDYVAILEQKSRETGREIVKSVSGDEDKMVEMALDVKGVADDKCLLEDLCDYPDGFEKCMIHLVDSGDMADGFWQAELNVSCDDKKNNMVNGIIVIINANMEKNSGELFVSIAGNESKYDEELEYRQNSVKIQRYNVEQDKKYGKKAIYKEEEPLPGTVVFSHDFTQIYNDIR